VRRSVVFRGDKILVEFHDSSRDFVINPVAESDTPCGHSGTVLPI